MEIDNILKKKLQSDKSVLGTWQVIASPTVSEIMVSAGFDFVIIDMEHGPITFETAENMIRAVETAGGTALLRVPDNNPSDILRALETGAHGIVVPQVETVEQAKDVVQASKYYPEGLRGFSPFTRSADYGKCDTSQLGEKKNKQSFVGILVEGIEGITNLPEIAKVEGIDLIYLGRYDLSQSLGVPGDVKHEKVISKMKECIEIIKQHGIAVGSIAGSEEDFKFYAEAGVNFVAYKADCALMSDSCADVLTKFRNF